LNIDDNVKMLEDSIGYVYENKNYALIALTHSSYAYEHGNKGFCSNERVEFLGDSVLNFIVTNRLFREASDMPEGEMSKMRASVVSEASLSKCAKKLKIGDILLLGKGERIMGGGKRNSILADAMEAIIGSLFLDSGLTAAEEFISQYLSDNYKKALQGTLFCDFKTKLQEEVQKKGLFAITYSIINEVGPDHDKTFTTAVSINDRIMGEGIGKTKKEAEQNAAGDALEKWLSQEVSNDENPSNET
jgi:ribonuclease-3